MPNVNLSVPDEVLWKLRAQAVASKERFGPYCVRLLVETGLKETNEPKAEPDAAEPVLGARREPVKGSALRVVRKAVVPRQDASAAVVQEEVAPPESQETPAKDAAVEFNTTEEFGIEAGEPEAVKAAPVFCELCETQLLEWSRTQMRCPKCRRNFPRAA